VPSVIIYNQCSDFELVSPEYFGRDITWHIPPDQKVDANTMTRVNFRDRVCKLSFATALTYKLQRKNSHKSNNQSSTDNTEDTSDLRLLVIWSTNYSQEFYVNVILIKYSNITAWDEDKTKIIDYMRNDITKRRGRRIEKTWLLDDTTVLVTTPRRREEECTLEITISEGIRKDNSIEPISALSSI
jgi:hypothetical protein